MVSHDLENPPQPPITNSLKVVVRATQYRGWNIFLSLVSYATTKRKKIKSSLKLRVFGLFSAFFFCTLIIKYPLPKSQQTSRVSTVLEVVVNLSYSFIPLQKILQKGVDRPVENPRKRIQNIKMAPNASNKFYWRMRKEIPLLVSVLCHGCI